MEEKAFVIALKVIGHRTLSHIGGTLNITQRLVTLCVSTIKDVRIYTVDGVNNVVSLAFILEDSSCAPHIRTLNAVNFLLPKYDNYDCYDAKLDRSKSNIVVTTEEGTICLWTLCNLVETCEAYHQTFVADNSNTISSKRQCLDSLAQRIQPKHTWKVKLHPFTFVK